MTKKRLVIDLTEVEHAELIERARRAGQTMSNYVRRHLDMDPRHQGIKHQEGSGAAGSAKVKVKKAKRK